MPGAPPVAAAGADAELARIAAVLQGMPVLVDSEAQVPTPLVVPEADFKRLLRAAAIARLPDVPAAQVDLAAFQRALDALAAPLRADGEGEAGFRHGAVFGRVLRLVATRPANRPDLIAIESTVRIVCGGDDSVALLARRAGRWVDVLDLDSGAIHGTEQAFMALEWRATPAAADGGFRVVASSITPWCQSNWRRLRTSVSQVAATRRARRVFAAEDGIYIGVEPPLMRLDLARDGFVLRYAAWAGPDRIVGPKRVAYRFVGGGVRRVVQHGAASASR